jgi:phage shock protein B
MTLTDVMVLGGLGIGVAFVVLVLPIWIIAHYLSKARIARALSAQDEKMLADLWQVARQMEERLNNLERVAEPGLSNASNRVREAAHV